MFRLSNHVAVLSVVFALLAPVAAQASWLRAESPHFLVFANTTEAPLRAFVQEMEDYDHLLRRMHQGDTLHADGAAKLEVYLVNGLDDLRRVFPTMTNQSAGAYASSPDGVFAVSFKPSQDFGNFIVQHEYYHHFMFQNFPGGYPNWMVEGMANYFASSVRRHGRLIVGGAPPGQLDALAITGWLPLDQLISHGASAFRTAQGPNYYAEAWLLTNYMMGDTTRRKQLIAYTEAVRNGEDSVKAWTEKVGEPPDVTQRKLHSTKIMALVLDSQPPQPVAIAVSPMPASAEAMLLAGQQLKNSQPIQAGQALLADIRKGAAQYPGDRLAELVLARAEIDIGDPDAAAALIKHRLAVADGDAEARLLQARLLMRWGDKDKARRTELYRQAGLALTPALKADARDFRLLYAYAQTRSVEPDYPSANMLKLLDNAVALAPQVQEIRFAAADAFISRGDYDHALLLLEPLAGDPHQPDAAGEASKQIERIKARKNKAPAAPADKAKP